MMVATFLPPFIPCTQLLPQIRQRGYALLAPDAVSELCGFPSNALDVFKPDWDQLGTDEYLKDAGRYRKRRHSCFIVDGDTVTLTAHRAHWQSLDYNALHGGMRRWFEPMRPETAGHPLWRHLLKTLAGLCSNLQGQRPWYVEAHQFRIDTADGIGRPTPEGAHRDGVDFVAVILVDRVDIKGGETRVFQADGPDGQRFTLDMPWSLMFLDDARVIHESTPIQPASSHMGHRDTCPPPQVVTIETIIGERGDRAMKLGSLKEGGRDGTLVVVSRDLTRAVPATGIATTLQQALEDWSRTCPRLHALSESLNNDSADGVFDLDHQALAAPLPRAYEFVDGSAYLPHVERVRRARNAEVPASFYTDPLMYQATSASFYGPRDPVCVVSEDYGIDLEAEIVVITDDVPMAVTPQQAAAHIQLIGLVNDVSLRNLIPDELAKGFGFLQSKPRSALSPVFVTPDELGPAWRDTKVHLPLLTHINGDWFGAPEAGEDMQFNFAQLIAHAAKTRPLAAGTLVGSGTIANQDTSRGASCFAEKRTVETLRDGKPSTPFMKFGDRVRIEMLDRQGASVFGAIEQLISPQPLP
ncbi:hypothetical protein FQR65_LT19407 [Abscondita terminalis]|nr:hypothetical protein FQR65_LT19407 [Abscondita terminalis]